MTTEYGFQRDFDSHVTWTTEDAAKRMCRDYGLILVAREVSKRRVVSIRD